MGSGREFATWCREAWRAQAVPSWRRILAEAEAAGDEGRAEYARALLAGLGDTGVDKVPTVVEPASASPRVDMVVDKLGVQLSLLAGPGR